MAPEDRKMMLEWASKRDELETSILPKLYAQNRANSATAIELATSATPEQLDTFLRAAGKYKKSETFDSVKAGFLQHLIDSSTSSVPGFGNTISAKNYSTMIRNYKEKGTLQKMFSDDEIDFLENKYTDYLSTVNNLPSLSAGMQVGELASGAMQAGPEAAEKLFKGNAQGAFSKVYDVATMGIPHRIMGHFLSKAASVHKTGDVGKAAKAAGISLKTLGYGAQAIRSGALFFNYMLAQQRKDDTQMYGSGMRVPLADPTYNRL
jgi:hypothetical protein